MLRAAASTCRGVLLHRRSAAAGELARLRDEESRPQVEALFQHDLLDPIIFGDVDDYRRIMRGEYDGHWVSFPPAPFDVIEHYERRAREGRRVAKQRAERKGRQERRKRARTSRPKKEGGRNDPCPCGSGRKYKRYCGP